MKKRLLLGIVMCFVVALLSIPASAATTIDSGYCGGEGDGTNLTWTLDDSGRLSIGGHGKMRDYDSASEIPWSKYTSGQGTYIKEIEFGEEVTSVGKLAFIGTQITTIIIPKNIVSIGERAFYGCDQLKNATIAASIIEDEAFYFGKEGIQYTLLSGVTKIGCYGALSGAVNIEIPDSVKYIGDGAFECVSGNNILKSITVDSNNSVYCSKDGVLFNKEMTELVLFPDEKDGDYTIPNGVKKFESSFMFGWRVSSISIPTSVTQFSFHRSTGSDQKRLDLYYAGSEEEWNRTVQTDYEQDPDFWHDNFNLHFNSTKGSQKHYVTVESGWGSGEYEENEDVTISATIPETDKWFRFKTWNGANQLIFTSGNANTPTATFKMPANDVTLSAVFEESYFSEPIHNAPTLSEVISSTSALIHEYRYVENMSPKGAAYGTGRLLVEASKALPDLSEYEPAQIIIDNQNNYVIQFYSSDQAEECANYLKQLSYVGYAEPDGKISVHSTSEYDSMLRPVFAIAGGMSNSWGVSAIGADIYAENLRIRGLSSEIVVGVVDSGVVFSHPFLKNRVLTGYDLVDDDSIPMDGDGHGTHVAGIIVDCTPGLNIKVLPVRVLDDDGYGYDSTVSQGIRYAVEHGAKVINLSLSGSHSDSVDAAVQYAITNNITVVIAAGNDAVDTAYACPAHIKGGITVAAVDSNKTRAFFSNYGNEVDISAPGVNIKSCFLGDQYITMDGTSMAAPHVSAAAALLLYGENGLTPAQVEKMLCDMAVDLGTPGWDKYYGAGFLNLSNSDTIPGKSIAFSDVPQDAYYYKAVMWAVSEGITNGTASTTFSPNETCSTAQILTFIWRAASMPEPASSEMGASTFSGSYFGKAMVWANESGITGMFAENTSDTPCTRASAMVYLWGIAGKPKIGCNPFTDVVPNSGYEDAVAWGVQRGVTNGTSQTTFSPDKVCTRAEIITFLYRYYVESVTMQS